MKEVVKQNGMALKFASDGLKGNHDIVKEAVKQNGMALMFASDGLKGNHDIVMLGFEKPTAGCSPRPILRGNVVRAQTKSSKSPSLISPKP